MASMSKDQGHWLDDVLGRFESLDPHPSESVPSYVPRTEPLSRGTMSGALLP